jgi:hypothetical protein
MRERRKQLTPEQWAKMDYYWRHVWPLEEMEVNRRWEFARNKIWRTDLPGGCTLLEPGAFRPECLNIYDGRVTGSGAATAIPRRWPTCSTLV